MRSRAWAAVLAGVILVAAGVALVRIGRELPPVPTPTATAAISTPSPAPPPSPTPGPFLYTVREGDTLSSIATTHGVTLEELIAVNGLDDPNLIHAGQVLVIPGLAALPLPTSTPFTVPPATPLPTPTPSGPPLVEIASVVGAGEPGAETVTVRNRGGAVLLEGWTLADAVGNRFTFPHLTLFSGGEVTLHSCSGHSSPTHLYWGRVTPAWTSGELITLRDQDGAVVDTIVVP